MSNKIVIAMIITIACLVILTIEALYFVIKMIISNHREKVMMIKEFKKGFCIIIYIVALPLYMIGLIYDGSTFLESFLSSIDKVISLVVLKFNYNSISNLMNDLLIYKITIYYCYLLVLINAIIFTISLIFEFVWMKKNSLKARNYHKERIFIYGNNQENQNIYQTANLKNKYLVANFTKEEITNLYLDQFNFININNFNQLILKTLTKSEKKLHHLTIIINTLNDEENITLCKKISELINKVDDTSQATIFKTFNVYVFGSPSYQSIYENIVKNSLGCIRYINKYQLVAMNFIEQYPLTKFMDETMIDYETSLVEDNLDINVLMIGFGKTNQEIFLASLANNQFMTKQEEDIVPKLVNYYIFDKTKADQNKNLNHNYYRYQVEDIKNHQDEYLPLPSKLAEEEYFSLDINDEKFYQLIKTKLTSSKKNINYLIIAFGNDLENIDLGKKLISKSHEWQIKNLTTFIKVRHNLNFDTLFKNENCYLIGDETKVVYDYQTIIGDEFFKMTQRRNVVYDLENDLKENSAEVTPKLIQKAHENSYKHWYQTMPFLERDSNLFACLSLRFKLNLMGLDYADENAPYEALSYEEYMKIYAKDDLPDTSYYQIEIEGKKIINYNLDFKTSRRQTMAKQEHQRWNAFMIVKGFVPAKIKEIENELIEKNVNGKLKLVHSNGKNYELRHHGNLTTYEGLIKFRKIIASRDHISELQTDVIKYDYQLLDDAYWFLTSSGKKIYRLKKNDKL